MLVDFRQLQNTEMFLPQQSGQIRRKLDKQDINVVNLEQHNNPQHSMVKSSDEK